MNNVRRERGFSTLTNTANEEGDRSMKTKLFTALVLLVGLATPAASQAPVDAAKKQVDWLCDWQQAVAEAKRTERPIMLAFGKPACEGVPGMW